jgi:hypothetical protein
MALVLHDLLPSISMAVRDWPPNARGDTLLTVALGKRMLQACLVLTRASKRRTV